MSGQEDIMGEHLSLDVDDIMREHLSLHVDRLITASAAVDFVPMDITDDDMDKIDWEACTIDISDDKVDLEACIGDDGNQEYRNQEECRICQEEDVIHNLESPCVCSGTLKYAHRKCIQQWCDEKGDTICEICHYSYKNGYKGPPRLPRFDVIPFRGVWGIIGSNPMELSGPSLQAAIAADRHMMEAENEAFSASVESGTACSRSAALILTALLIVRYVLSAAAGIQENASELALFILIDFCLKAAGFLLPCYIITHAINIFQRRRRRLDAAVLAAAQLAIRIHEAGQARAIRLQQALETRGMQDAVASAHELP